MGKKVNAICIKWGNVYEAEYVNKLKNMIKRNTSYEVNFYCFTDDSKGFDEDIIVKPLPILNTKEKYQTLYSYRKEAGLCDDNLGGLKGERVFFFDLDVVMISNLDELFDYPEDEKFYIINDWNSKGENVGQASCYSWVVGTLGFVKEHYEQNSEKVFKEFYTAAQEYLSSEVIKKFGKLNFWPDSWFCSFRYHCLPKFGPLRHFLTPSIPSDRKDLKVIVFHGVPNPREALNGIWPKKGTKDIKFWKKIYKKCKPTPWVETYWK